MYPSPNPWATPRGAFGLVVFVLCLVGLLMIYLASKDPDPKPDRGVVSAANPVAKPETVPVERVVDGDTVLVSWRGDSEYVRYIGIDTPESVVPDQPIECFGEQSKDFNERLVDGLQVKLVFDQEKRDRFGRLLAYVYAGGRMLNAEILRRGYATTLTIPPNDSRADQFEEIEQKAEEDNLGLWAACR